jgi:hypothetical protein
VMCHDDANLPAFWIKKKGKVTSMTEVPSPLFYLKKLRPGTKERGLFTRT